MNAKQVATKQPRSKRTRTSKTESMPDSGVQPVPTKRSEIPPPPPAPKAGEPDLPAPAPTPAPAPHSLVSEQRPCAEYEEAVSVAMVFDAKLSQGVDGGYMWSPKRDASIGESLGRSIAEEPLEWDAIAVYRLAIELHTIKCAVESNDVRETLEHLAERCYLLSHLLDEAREARIAIGAGEVWFQTREEFLESRDGMLFFRPPRPNGGAQ